MKKVISVFLAVLMVVTMLPLSVFAENTSSVLDSGFCGADGDNLTWTLYKDGELVINGEGAMKSYSYSTEAPWDGYRESVFELTIETGVTAIGDYAFRGTIDCYYQFENVNIPEGVTYIGDYAFYFSKKLEKVSLPDTLKTIGRQAFCLCTSLSEINIPEGVTSIGNGVFQSCYRLMNITIPLSVTSMGKSVFGNYSNVEKIIFADGFQTISAGAFDGCNTINCVVIPASVTTVEEEAFNGCSGINTVYYRGTDEQWNNITFGTGNGYLKTAENIVFNAICHDYETTEIFPTCVKNGYASYVCKICGDSYIGDYVDATGHTEQILEAKSATCTETGLTEGKKCSVCDEIIVAQEEIPATGHDYECVVTDPTCTEDGFTVYSCHCGDSYSPDEIVPATGHTPGEWEVVAEAQIGVDGLEQQKCTVCGEIVDEKVIPALPDYLVGDANGDGKITAADARIALRISAKVDSLEKYNLATEALDVTGDGKLNAADARKILRIAAQIDFI